MKYISVKTAAEKWKISERSVRNYCAMGRVDGAVFSGKTWRIPEEACKPDRKKRAGKLPNGLLDRLKAEKDAGIPGGIYHKIQIELTYNSNRIEGSGLTHDQTRYIFETNTIGMLDKSVNVDDIIETSNHFRCIDRIIESANYPLSEAFIKQLHRILKTGTLDSRRPWFAVGEYKRLENEVGGDETIKPKEVSEAMKKLISSYNSTREKSFEEIVEFHYDFEKIHPFQDGNGRVGRLIMFRECLRNHITPFIIEDDIKKFYYRGLKMWKEERGYLLDTCRAAQDRFEVYLDYFGVRT